MKRKTIINQNLRGNSYWFVDETLTSPEYFQITEFPTQLTAGKNLFKLKASTNTLRVGSMVNVEVIDFNGNPIYHEVLNYLDDDKSRVVSIYVYSDTPVGDCIVTVTGEAINVPDQWKGIPNIRWTRSVTVNSNIANTSEIIFDNLPVVTVTEQVATHLDRTYTLGQTPTYSTGLIRYFSFNGQPAIELSGGKFTNDMGNGTVTVSAPQNPTPLRNLTLPTTAFTSSIKKILSDSLALLDTEYTVYSTTSFQTYTYTAFENSAYSISYTATPTYVATQNSESYAIIEIDGLQPSTGDVSRIKTFMNNNGTVGTWELINDIELTETEIFVSNTASLYPDLNIGSFTSQSVIDTYWQGYTYVGKTTATAPTLTWSTSSIMNAMSITGVTDISAKNAVRIAQIKSAYRARFIAENSYKITIDADSTKTDSNNPRLSIYMSGSAFDYESTDYFTQNLATNIGRRVGYIELNSSGRVDDYVIEFEADRNGSAVMLLVVESGDWQVSNIRTTTNNDTGYTPNYTRIRSLVPTAHKSNNQLSFKTEYYNVAGERSKQINYIYDKSWTGGNRYIDGDYSMITGSLYVADTLESGIAITGQKNTGYVRSLGYTGFDAGNPGFLIWSGSALPGATSKGSAYSGVGIELYSNTSSYFRYSTRDSELDVRTDKFFLGSAGQFISGANGNIEISSSGFHLDAAGNITASNGEFRGNSLADFYQYRVIQISSDSDPHISTYVTGSKTYTCLNLTGSYDPTFDGGTGPAMFIKITATNLYPIGAIKIHPDSWSTGSRYQNYGGTVVIEGPDSGLNTVYIAKNAYNASLPDSYIAGATVGLADGDYFQMAFETTTATVNGTNYDKLVVPLNPPPGFASGTGNRVMLIQSVDSWTINSFTDYYYVPPYYANLYVQNVTGIGDPNIDFWANSGTAKIPFIYAQSLFLTSSLSDNLSIQSYENYGPIINFRSGSSGTTLGSLEFNGNNEMYLGTKVSKNLYLTTDNTQRLTILSNGNVGIGTTTPTSILDVSGDVTITGSLNITGSTTQIGNNRLLGNTTLSGSIIISGSATTPTTPTIKIYGDMETNGVIKFMPVTKNIDTSISASYIYVSGSTNDLYFSQNGSGYNNVTRLRWIEGNLYTGLLHGGLITTQSSTVFQVASGSGIIVTLNATVDQDPYPTVQYLTWPNLSASIAPLSSSYDQSFVAINSSGQIAVQGTPYTDGQFNDRLTIGVVVHQNRSTINAVQTFPSTGYGWKQRSKDFVKAFGPLKISGYTLSPSGSSTGSLVLSGGTSWVDGRNYTIDPSNPSYIVEANGITTSKIYRYYQTGSTWIYDTNAGAGYATIDPTRYSNNGTLTSVPTNDWTIQRVYYFPNSGTKALYIYYGNDHYATQAEALAAITTETFTEAPNTAENAIYVGYMLLRHNANFTVPASYAIQAASLFRAAGSGGGSGGGGSTSPGGSTNNIQYNNAGVFGGDSNFNTNGAGAVSITGSLRVSAGITASLQGTSSFAVTASYALASPKSNPGGASGNIQYNDGVNFAGDSNFSTNGAGNLNLTGSIKISNAIQDTSGDTSILPSSRLLYTNGANNIALDWTGVGQYLDTNLYLRKILSTTVQENFLKDLTTVVGPNWEGETVQATIDGSVSQFDLVCLQSDGTWYQVDQTTDTSTKMLGIYVGQVESIDVILLEGSIGVHGGSGTNGPRVSNVDNGLVVYIQEASVAKFDTNVPATNYVRTLGHCYYNSTSDSEYWIFKFRPSNDWYFAS
jgi:hypothetical protein